MSDCESGYKKDAKEPPLKGSAPPQPAQNGSQARHASPSPSSHHNICVAHTTTLLYEPIVNSDQARRFLARNGCTFEPGKGGHLLVRRADRSSILPQHGGRKQLGIGLWLKILKDLGLKEKQ